MPEGQLRPISAAERRARHARVVRIARRLGFVGRVEYRHVYGRAGGAQFGLGISSEHDLLIVHAEAFERDADPDDFSLEAILAHERGHQILARHPSLAPRVAGTISSASEEILASIIGAIISEAADDHDLLLAKATVELLERGEQPEIATRLISQLKRYLERLL